MEQAKIDKINELALKKKTAGLTQEEEQLQQQLRREYIDSYKRSLLRELDQTYVVDEQGNKKKLERKPRL